METFNNLSIGANIILMGIPWFYIFTLRWLYMPWRFNLKLILIVFFYYQLEIAPQFVNSHFDVIDLAKLIWEYMF